MWLWALDYLACPACRNVLRALRLSADSDEGILGHEVGPCVEVFPVIEGIPRLLLGSTRVTLTRERADWFVGGWQRKVFWSWIAEDRTPTDEIVARFDREWRTFPRVGSEEQGRLFAQYFDLIREDELLRGRVAVDAGCGAGRWAREVARRGARVIALDLGRSVEIARRNLGANEGIAFVQADICHLPIRDESVDLVYSLGVLHHIEDTAQALSCIASAIRPGGGCLVYLYYALETRSAAYRVLFRSVDLVRSITSLLPQPMLQIFSTMAAATVYWPLARFALALKRLGLQRAAGAIPLSFYADLSFETMRNDSLDRFGTRLEKRFSRRTVMRLLESAGLERVQISEGVPYWHALALKPNQSTTR